MDSLRRRTELHGRYVLAAQLASKCRVLDLGCGDAEGAAQLMLAEAASVVLVSRSPERAQQTLDGLEIEGVEVQPELSLPLPFDAGSFDLIICHDVAERLTTDERWAQELRRILKREGYLLAAVANPEGAFLSELGGEGCASALSYEEIYEQLGDLFETMTLFGQSPVIANLFFDFEDDSEEPGLLFDRSLLTDDDDNDSGWFVLIFGPEAQHREDLAIVQLPFSRLKEAIAKTRIAASMHGVSAATESATFARAASPDDQLEGERDVLRRHEMLVWSQESALRTQEHSLRAAETRAVALLQQHAALMLERDRAEIQCKHLRDELGALHCDAAAFKNVTEPLQSAKADLAELPAQTSADPSADTRQVEQLQSELNRAVAQCDELKQQLQDVIRERDALRAQPRAAQEGTEATVTLLKAQISGIREANQSQLHALTADLKTTKELLDKTQRRMANLQDEHANAMRVVAGERDGFERRASAAEKELQVLRSESDTTNVRLSETQLHLSEAQQQLGELHDQIACLQSDKATLSERIEALKNQVVEAESTSKAALADALGRAHQLDEEVSRLRSDRASFEAQIKDLLDETHTLRASTAAALEEKKEALEKRAPMEQELLALREQLSEERAAREGLSEALKEQKDRAAGFENELEQTRSRLDGIEQERQTLANEVHRLTQVMHKGMNQATEGRLLQEPHTQIPPPSESQPRAEGSNVALGHLHASGEYAGDSIVQDAVGRRVEETLEDLEDLLSGGSAAPGDNS